MPDGLCRPLFGCAVIWRQAAVLAAGAVVLATVVRLAQRRAREAGGMAASIQVLVGLICGAVGAALAVIPNGDAVPDDLEVPLLAVAGVGAVVLVAGALRLRIRARRPSPTGEPVDAVRV